MWQMCASLRIVDAKVTAAATTPEGQRLTNLPAPIPAPICGGERQGCCLKLASDEKECAQWSSAELLDNCILSRAHCENGTGTHQHGGVIYGCGGTWMGNSTERCAHAQSEFVCGHGCTNATSDGAGARRWCRAYSSVTSGCTASQKACEAECGGAWLPVP